MKLLNEKRQTKDSNIKLRLWEIKIEVIYEEDYETPEEYKKVCRDFQSSDSWVLISSDSSRNRRGGYSIYQKVED